MARLREDEKEKIDSDCNLPIKPSYEGKYFIPKGLLFAYISCPHYLSEILVYISLVIFTAGKNVSIW